MPEKLALSTFEQTEIDALREQYYHGPSAASPEELTFGVEQETMIVDKYGKPVNEIDGKKANSKILDALGNSGRGFQDYIEKDIIGTELDACQIEYKTPEPTSDVKEIMHYLIFFHQEIKRVVEDDFNLRISYEQVPDHNFEAVPSDGERYQGIHNRLLHDYGPDIRKCTNILARHVHTGKVNLEDSIRIMNQSSSFLQNLRNTYNKSNRLIRYEKMVKKMVAGFSFDIPYFEDTDDFLHYTLRFGDTPNDNYALMRPTRKSLGTLETRPADSADPEIFYGMIVQHITEVRDFVEAALFTSDD